MLRRLDLRDAGPDPSDRLPRPEAGGAGPVAAVQQILAEVRAGGDDAVRRFTETFDGVAVDDLRVPPAEVAAALVRIAPPLRAALDAAHANITDYHRTQLTDEVV